MTSPLRAKTREGFFVDVDLVDPSESPHHIKSNGTIYGVGLVDVTDAKALNIHQDFGGDLGLKAWSGEVLETEAEIQMIEAYSNNYINTRGFGLEANTCQQAKDDAEHAFINDPDIETRTRRFASSLNRLRARADTADYPWAGEKSRAPLPAESLKTDLSGYNPAIYHATLKRRVVHTYREFGSTYGDVSVVTTTWKTIKNLEDEDFIEDYLSPVALNEETVWTACPAVPAPSQSHNEFQNAIMETMWVFLYLK